MCRFQEENARLKMSLMEAEAGRGNCDFDAVRRKIATSFISDHIEDKRLKIKQRYYDRRLTITLLFKFFSSGFSRSVS